MNRVFIFPGQGSQTVGMGKEFYDTFPIAKETLNLVDSSLNYRLSEIIFNGPDEDLTSTVNAQPALMAVSMAMLNTIMQQSNLKINLLCSYVAGHSLGEYSALCASGAISLDTAARLLQVRGRAMQEACQPGEGVMEAIIGMDLVQIEEIIDSCRDGGLGVCQVANDNVTGQVVISGHSAYVNKVSLIVKDLGYKSIRLKVSSPFHCSLMQKAERKMAAALEIAAISQPLTPLIANYTAEPTSDIITIKQNLIAQICARVRWRESMDKLSSLGVEEVVEIGNAKVLTGMLRRAGYRFKLTNISNLAEFDQFMSIL